MLKTINMVQICCPEFFFEVIMAVLKQKILNGPWKWHKTQSFPIFKVFKRFFVKFLTDVVDWNVKKGQQEKSFSPVGFS